jgi:uncharacterized protein (DUF1501 family)
MTAQPQFSRRAVLGLGAGFAVSFMGQAALAAATGDRKLVVIVARGAMDGLSVAPPVGDPAYAALRGQIAIPREAALPIDATFGLHPSLSTLHGLIKANQARIAPAVAIPVRVRSHFDAQDVLETGEARLYGVNTGWLNRALTVSAPLKGLSVGDQTPLIIRGPVQAQSWSPGGRAPKEGDRVAGILQDLYKDDPLLGPALASGLSTEAMAGQLTDGQPVRPADAAAFAATTGKFLVADGGPSVAVLSLTGFDTHANQGAAQGQLANRLKILDQVIDGLQAGLGPAWSRTTIVVATEFGRTARVNGTGGTDHGTASTLILAGGALKPGGIIGDWPTLAQGKLYEDRDLAPTLDVRSVFKGVLADHLGLERAALDQKVFPDSASAPALRGLVA